MGLIERPAGTTDEVLRAIAEPNRRAILQLVAREEMAAGDVAAHFPVTRPAISQHLAVLLAAGLVSERRVGTKRLFRARPEGLDDLRAFLAEMWPMALGSFKAAAEAGAKEMESEGTNDDDRRTNLLPDRLTLWQQLGLVPTLKLRRRALSRASRRARFFGRGAGACPSCISLTHSQPGLADGPIRGSSGTSPSRRACTYARSSSIRARS